jgi:pyruvate-ferredoxin/flavodoxin oxidoreductase
LDSKEPSLSFEEYAYKETRFKMLSQFRPEEAKRLSALAQADLKTKWHLIRQMAAIQYGTEPTKA